MRNILIIHLLKPALWKLQRLHTCDLQQHTQSLYGCQLFEKIGGRARYATCAFFCKRLKAHRFGSKEYVGRALA